MATGGASTGISSRQTQRIQKDLAALNADPLPFLQNLQLEVVDNLNELSGVLIGPKGSDYAGGYFRFLIRFPPEYPFKPPDFFFLTRICHPNVDSRTGTTCHDQLLATWAPSVTLKKLLSEMHGLLAKPNYDTQVEDSITDKSPEKAKQETKSFAQPL
jgi:ubiquitin-protein ligase